MSIQRVLLDKQDEMCVIFEQIARHEEVMKRGELSLKKLEEELKLLEVQVNDFVRKMDILQRKIPDLQRLDKEVEDLKFEIAREEKDVEVLAQKLEIPEKSERKRQYCGRDFTGAELDGKLKLYEERLLVRRNQLAECSVLLKDLEEQIEEIQAELIKYDDAAPSLIEAGVNLRVNIMEMRRKKMAALSEMAVYQAQQGELEEEKGIVVRQLEEASARSGRGEAFDARAAKSLALHDRDVKTARTERKKSIYDDEDEGSDDDEVKVGGRRKYDAYPTSDGLSRPYGANPVFQPGPPAPNLKYYRKGSGRPLVL
jgi:chromosome segregation ATPase